VNNSEFCENCGCQKDEYRMNSKLCEDCWEDWAEENEVYL
jgi:NMD protein affecting ribosome stability and mRNA decay